MNENSNNGEGRISSEEGAFVRKRRDENKTASDKMDAEGLTKSTALSLLFTRLTEFSPAIQEMILKKATEQKPKK